MRVPGQPVAFLHAPAVHHGQHISLVPDREEVHLHEVLAYLSQRGVTSILLMAQHGLIGPDMQSPLEASYLADIVLLLRYFESFGEVFEAALRQEESVTGQINALYELCFKNKAFAEMTELQWFLTEQVEEEKTAREIVAPADFERLVTWMDANALFYGTFDPADQARQRRGESIAGPKVE